MSEKPQIELKINGSIGIVTDGDRYTRPYKSCTKLNNFDFDTETNLIKTRNSTVNSTLLDGLTIPSGYEIMPDGIGVFSFNAPIDRQVVLVFLRNASTGGVKIYTNTWFNPPAPATEGNNDYENYISGVARSGWQNEWIELTENIQLTGVIVSGGIAVSFEVTNTNLSNIPNYYRGWFAWNATKWNAGSPTDLRKNHSFVCIEAWTPAIKTFNIQERTGLHLSDLGWNTDDKIFLIRYPIMVHKANDTTVATTDLRMNFETVRLIKTNTSVKCLIGQDGNLWFGFINKDIIKLSQGTRQYSYQNRHKYYGWWLDYETIPVMPDTTFLKWNGGVAYTHTFDPRYGLTINIAWADVGSDTHRIPMLALLGTLDGYQDIAIAKGLDHVLVPFKYAPRLDLIVHHAYSRRLTRLLPYALYRKITETIIFEEDPVRATEVGWGETRTTNANITLYSIFYDYSNTLYTTSGTIDIDNTNGEQFGTIIGYGISEPIFTADKFGVLAGDIIFTGGDDNKADRISHTLIQDGVPSEDLFPLQNRRNVGSSDKDKLITLITLGNKVVCIKNNSMHVVLPTQDGLGFRLLGSIAKIGTQYYKTVTETPIGISFVNDDGWWVYDLNQVTNILEGYRLQEFYALDKSIMFAEWNTTRKELWLYVGNNKIWILNISRQKQIGFNDYQFPVSWDIINFTQDEDKNFYIVQTNSVIKYNKDNDIVTGTDANGSGISYDYEQNLMLIPEQRATRHHRWKVIEVKIFVEMTPRDSLPEGNTIDIINVEMYRNGETVPFLIKPIKINATGSIPETLTLRNTISNNHRAFKLRVYGTLNYFKRFVISEVYIRAIPLVQHIKAGVKPQVLVQ